MARTPAMTALLLSAILSGAALSEPLPEARWSSYRDFWFDYESAQIDKADAGKISDVANYARQNPSYRFGIDVVADADAPLRQRRVEAVRAALVHAGVPGYKIQQGPFGSEPFRRSRRVEILVDPRD
jgi:outer membrane protein OmpA-like peptidoglycan-associated protein